MSYDKLICNGKKKNAMIPAEIGVPVLLSFVLLVYAGVIFVPGLLEKWKKSHRKA